MSASLFRRALSGAVLAALCVGWHAASAQPAKPLRKVVIAVGTQVLNSSYPYVLMPAALGYWQQEGLDVEVIAAGGSQQAIQQMVGKSADFVEINSSSFIQSMATTGVQMRALMANTTPDWSLVSMAGGPVKSITDFKGRTIGISNLGSGGIPMVQAYLRANGVDPEKDITIQPTGFGGMALEALKSGRVDGLMYWGSAILSFEIAGAKFNYFRAPEWQTYADFSLVSLASTVSADPALAESVVRGMAKASLFVATNPECARRVFWKKFPQMRSAAGDEAARIEFDRKMMELGRDSAQKARALGGNKGWAVASQASYERMQQFMIDNKVIAKGVPANTLVHGDAAFYERANRFDENQVRQEATGCAAG